ncbi:MAG TPA: hypothetical protein VK773_12370 [Acidimicrobiales bacterium]|nr:hypothetical protein [Acidimicrobiales bacterium]
MSPRRVRRVEVPDQIAASFARSTANYAAAFAVTTDAARTRTSRQWASAVFERAPAGLRSCMVFGWTRMLRLKLGPRPSDDHVLGWAIAEGELVARSTALTAESRFLRATNIVMVGPSSVTWVTLVHYSHAVARPLWTMARPIHHLTIRHLLARAARETDSVTSPSETAA